ncbi:MAG: hypothetical protein FJ087_14015 [Deltaproteobacteria bacterium]|nr:hypothetical protein [Deltaproteobacteria bacterium]
MRNLPFLLAFAVACSSGGGGGPAADHGPDGTPDVAPDPSPDPAPEDAPDAAPDPVPDPVPDPEPVPEPVPEPADVLVPEPSDLPPADPGADAPPWHEQYGLPCAPAKRVGDFAVEAGFTSGVESFSVAGDVTDKVEPLSVLKVEKTDGPCTLFRRVSDVCIPACTPGLVCASDTCVPAPAPLDAGTITVTGLVKPVSMVLKGGTYWDTDFDVPPFEPGARVELSASGAAVPAFALQGEGVPLIEIPGSVITVGPDDPLAVTWTAAPGPWRVYLSINIDQHGHTPLTLRCEVEDTGSFTIPESLKKALLDDNPLQGAPTCTIQRRTIDSTDVTQGCIELSVRSSRRLPVCVEGWPCGG